MRKNIAFLDFLRVISILAVIAIHTAAGVLTKIAKPLQTNIYLAIIYTFLFCVPIFFMISGTLFLNPEKKVPLKALFFKYIRRLALTLFIFGTAFALALIIIKNQFTFKPIFLWQAFSNMLKGENSGAHMWFLYDMLIIYLLIPILKPIINRINKSLYLSALIVLFAAFSLLPCASQLMHWNITVPLFPIFVFYFLCGDYIYRFVDCNKIPYPIIISTIIICLIGIYANIFHSLGIISNYNMPFVAIYSMAIYILARKKIKSAPKCAKLRPYIFSVYIIHNAFIAGFYKVFNITPLMCGGYILLPLFACFFTVISFATAYVMKKIPILSKYVL